MFKKTKVFALGIIVATIGLGSPVGTAAESSSGLRGVNVPSIWFDRQSYDALSAIKKQSFNTVRIVWNTSGSAIRLQQIVDKCTSLNLKPILELHDATGKNDINSLMNCANYWSRSDIKAVLKSSNKIWVNVANEWGPANSTGWRDGYINAIKMMRSSGITNVIVVDSGGWGQDRNDILKFASSILNSDPKRNIMFSIHMYGNWNNNADIDSFLTSCKRNGIPIIVGEFGYNANNGNNNLGCKVDAIHLMKKCKSMGIGFIAWSWCGNDSPNAWLDMTNNWGSFTTWGKLVKNNMW